MAELKVTRYAATVTADGETLSITAVANLDRSFVRVTNNRFTTSGSSTATGNHEPDDLSVAVVLTAVDTVTFRRPTVTPGRTAVMVDFEIVEYIGAVGGDHEFRVRSRNTVALTSALTNTGTLTTAATDADKCIPYINGIESAEISNKAQSLGAVAYLESTTTLRVNTAYSDAVVKRVYVEVVEYIGSAWTVYHGRLDGSTADNGSINLVTGSDGISGSAANITDWANAWIDSWGHAGDAVNENIADLWPRWSPGTASTVAFTFHGQHIGSDDDLIAHVLVNSQVTVTRFTPNETGELSTDVDVTSAGLTDLAESSVVASATASGTTNNYAMGWRNYRLTTLTNVNHRCHRTGGALNHEIQVIDFTAMTDGGGGAAPGGRSFTVKVVKGGGAMLSEVSHQAHDGTSLVSGRFGPAPEPPSGLVYTPANWTEPAWIAPQSAPFADPFDDIVNYRTTSLSVPEVEFVTQLFINNSRSTAVTTSNQEAGEALTDPLVRFGEPQPPNHAHTFLGNRLSQTADLFDLANEPIDWEPGSQAANRGVGFPGLITSPTGKFGYSPGVWWPEIFYNGVKLTIKSGIATYYTRQNYHAGERVFLIPNGAGWVTPMSPPDLSSDDTLYYSLNETAGDYRISVKGPGWFHEDIHVGPFPEIGNAAYNNQYLSWKRTKPAGAGWHAAAEFQIYVKFPKPAGTTLAGLAAAGGGTNRGYLAPGFSYGGPASSPVTFHLDYVSAWTDYAFGTELLDRCCNRDINVKANNIKYEAFRPSWVG